MPMPPDDEDRVLEVQCPGGDERTVLAETVSPDEGRIERTDGLLEGA